MRTATDQTTSSQSGRLSSGFPGVASIDFRSMISPWGYRHLRGIAAVHFAVGVFLAGLGAVMLSHGFYGWAALPLAGLALNFAVGCADIAVARSASPSR